MMMVMINWLVDFLCGSGGGGGGQSQERGTCQYYSSQPSEDDFLFDPTF